MSYRLTHTSELIQPPRLVLPKTCVRGSFAAGIFRVLSGMGDVKWVKPKHKIKVLTNPRDMVESYSRATGFEVPVDEIIMVNSKFIELMPFINGRWSFYTERHGTRDTFLNTYLSFEFEEDAIAAKMAIGDKIVVSGHKAIFKK